MAYVRDTTSLTSNFPLETGSDKLSRIEVQIIMKEASSSANRVNHLPIQQQSWRHQPTLPSTISRMRSACPLCRAYSSIMWLKIHRKEQGSPSRIPVSSIDSPAAASRAKAHSFCHTPKSVGQWASSSG